MRHLFALLALLALTLAPSHRAVPPLMWRSLEITDTSTDRIECGSDAVVDDVDPGTLMLWVYATSIANDQSYLAKTETSGSYQGTVFSQSVLSRVRLTIDRSTSDLIVTAPDNTAVANTWQFLAVRWDLSGAAADQEIFVGTLTSAATEVASYPVQQVGSGSRVSDAARTLTIGNISGGQTWGALPGYFAHVQIESVRLTDAQIRAQQFHPHITPTTVFYYSPGWGGAGVSASGVVQTCTGTGTNTAQHVPLDY